MCNSIRSSAGPTSHDGGGDELPQEYLNSSLFREAQAPPKRSNEDDKKQQEEDELQMALALSLSEEEAAKQKQKEVCGSIFRRFNFKNCLCNYICVRLTSLNIHCMYMYYILLDS